MNGVKGMYENQGQDAIDFKDIIKILKKRIILLIIVPVIFAIIGWIFSRFFINPTYEATTTLIVKQSNDSTVAISKGDVDLSKSLIYTYAEIAKSKTVLDNTKEALNLDELKSKTILISPVEDTQILKIEVLNDDPNLAMDIANTFVEQFTLEVVRITSTDNVAVVDYARIPEKPVKPNILLNTVIAGMLGEMIILLIVFIREYLDNTIRSEKDIEIYLNTPVVCTIPNFSQGGKVVYEGGKVYGESPSVVSSSGSI